MSVRLMILSTARSDLLAVVSSPILKNPKKASVKADENNVDSKPSRHTAESLVKMPERRSNVIGRRALFGFAVRLNPSNILLTLKCFVGSGRLRILQ